MIPVPGPIQIQGVNSIQKITYRPEPGDTSTTLASWFIVAPFQGAFWDKYIFHVLHLRDVPGVSPASKNFPAATHEFFLAALDPQEEPNPLRVESWRHLVPVNLVCQVELPSDESALLIAEHCMKQVLAGHLWAEPLLSGQTEPWVSILNNMAKDHRKIYR